MDMHIPQRFALFFATLFLVGASSLNAQAEVRLLDSIAAVVDDDVVMTSELHGRIDTILQRIAASGTEAPSAEALAPQVLDRLILERIQMAMARRAGVRVSDGELNQAIANLASRQGMTPEQFLDQARLEGLTVPMIKEQLTMEILIARVQENQVSRRIFISEQEIDNFLSSEEGQNWSSPEVHLGHILIALSSAASEEESAAAYATANTILAKLEEGEDFRTLAITHSTDQSALQGGDIGWRRTSLLPGIFIPVVNELQPGEVSKLIRSDAGVHILKLYERRGADRQMITQSKVRHILLKPNEIRDDDATRLELDRLASEIRNGDKSFAELAREHSEDIGSALSGGDLGWSVPGKFLATFEQVVDHIPLEDVSTPFRTQFGWHIVQVTERRTQDFSDEIKRAQARNILQKRKFEEELQLWLQEIRDRAYVEIKI